MRYQDKSAEEIRAIIDGYIEQTKKSNKGRSPDLEKLAFELNELALEKDKNAFLSVFEGFTASSLRLAAELTLISNENIEVSNGKSEEVKSFDMKASSLTNGVNPKHKQHKHNKGR